MKVLAIYPAFDTAINEMAMTWETLCASGALRCTVMAGSHDALKGLGQNDPHSCGRNLQVHRLDSGLRSMAARNRVAELSKAVRPDVIFCATHGNLSLAKVAQRAHHAPIVLHTEFFFDEDMGIRRRYFLGLALLRRVVNAGLRKHLRSHARLILCSNPVEFSDACTRPDDWFRYLPWPHPGQAQSVPRHLRDATYCVYIGSLSRAKGAGLLAQFLAELLTSCPEYRLLVVGPTMDKAGMDAVSLLRAAAPDRVTVKKHCSRTEAIEHMSRAMFVLSPGKRMGWGLIGDAWNAGTPIVSAATHYDLKSGENCLVAKDPTEFVAAVRELRHNERLWNSLAEAGRKKVHEHSIARVASILLDALVQAKTAPYQRPVS